MKVVSLAISTKNTKQSNAFYFMNISIKIIFCFVPSGRDCYYKCKQRWTFKGGCFLFQIHFQSADFDTCLIVS